jgi:hypothetical protein
MERLALCCKVLYDIDLLDKKKEIEFLKKKITAPKIIIKKNIIQDFRQKIFSLIFDSAEQFIQIRYVGLSDFYKKDIEQIIFMTLNELSDFKNPEWCNIKAISIADGIDSSLCGLVDILKLNNFTREEMAEFIIKSTIYQIKEI